MNTILGLYGTGQYKPVRLENCQKLVSKQTSFQQLNQTQWCRLEETGIKLNINKEKPTQLAMK